MRPGYPYSNRLRSTDSATVILLEGLNTSLPHQLATKHAVVELLTNLPASSTSVAIYALEPTVKLICDFGQNPRDILESLNHHSPYAGTNVSEAHPDPSSTGIAALILS